MSKVFRSFRAYRVTAISFIAFMTTIVGMVSGEIDTQREVTVEEFFQISYDWKIAWATYTSYLIGNDKYTSAVEACDEALQKFPDDKDFIWNILSTKQAAFKRAGLYDEAVKCLKTWYSIFKDDHTILADGQPRSFKIKAILESTLASIYQKQANYDKAIDHYRKYCALITPEVVERYPLEIRIKAKVTLNVKRPIEIGNCYFKLGKYDLALQEYNRALEYSSQAENFAYGDTEERKKAGEQRRAYYLSKLSELIAKCRSKPQ